MRNLYNIIEQILVFLQFLQLQYHYNIKPTNNHKSLKINNQQYTKNQISFSNMDIQHLTQPQLTLTQQLSHQPYTFQRVKLQIASSYHTIEFMTSLDIAQTRLNFIIDQELSDEGKQVKEIVEEGKHLMIGFGNVSGVGVQGQKVMVFMEDQNQEDQQEEQEEQFLQYQHQGIIKPMTPQYQNTGHSLPAIFKHLKTSQTCHVNLHGNYTLSLTFTSQQNRLKAHELLTNYLKSQQQSQPSQQFPLGQMISAQDINQDGTINKINHSGEEQQSQGQQQQANEK